MVRLWLPIKKFNVPTKRGGITPVKMFEAQVDGRRMTVIIPQTGDKQWDEYLEEAEREKTLNELEGKRRPMAKISRADIIGALKEYRDWFRRRQR